MHCRKTAKRQTPRLTEYTKAEGNFYESHNCTSGLSSYCWQCQLFLTTPLKHIAGVELYLHSFLTSALDGEGCKLHLPGRFLPGKQPTLRSV